MASETVASRSSVTMSVRGSITSRTIVSLNSKIEWMSSRSSFSSTSRSVASSTMLSSCSSLEKVALRGRPGVTRLPIATSASASGPIARRTPRMRPPVTRRRGRGWVRPTLRGLEPTRMNETAIMMSALTARAHHHSSMRRANARVTSTAAIVSATMRRKLTALTWAPTSFATARRVRGFFFCEARSTMSVRLTEPRAASMAAMRPPKATSRAATMKKTAVIIALGGARRG